MARAIAGLGPEPGVKSQSNGYLSHHLLPQDVHWWEARVGTIGRKQISMEYGDIIHFIYFLTF